MNTSTQKNIKDHDYLAAKAGRSVLKKVRLKEKGWNDHILSSDMVEISKRSTSFPSPDYVLSSKKNKNKVWFEFKPYSTERKRGMLTGLGQSIAYLTQNCSASYLIMPNKVKDLPDAKKFFTKLFKENISGKIPVGLIMFDINDPTKVEMVCGISQQVNPKLITSRGDKEQYWTWWRDTPPHAIQILLDLNIDIGPSVVGQDRTKLIWDEFYDSYLCPPEVRVIDLVPNRIVGLDGEYQVWRRTKKKMFHNGRLSEKDLLKDIRNSVSKTIKDNNYQDYKKNHFITLDQLNLIEFDSKRITEVGKRFLERLKECDDDNSKRMKEFSYLMVGWGDYHRLISDIKEFQENNELLPVKQEDFLLRLQEEFDERGFYRWNQNRSTSAVRSFLQAERQLWHHFKFKEENFYDSDIGWRFNDDFIQTALDQYYEIYADLLSK